MLLWDLFLQVHTAIGNLQGKSASFHGRITVGKAVRIFWLEKTRCVSRGK